MSILAYILKRLAGLAASLFALSLVLFFLVRLLPGDPAQAMLGLRATPETLAVVRKQLGLDQPILVQFLNYYADLIHGDLGTSIAGVSTTGALSGRPVADIVSGGLEVTAWLAILGMVVAAILGIALGVAAATRKRWWSDGALSSISLLGISIPDFFLALMLLVIFARILRWFPSIGFVSPLESPVEGLRTLALPVMTIAIVNMSAVARITRSTLRDLSGAEFIEFARSKGMRSGVVLGKHALRAALVPIVTVIGLQLGFLFGGVVVVESVFGLPGMGRLLIVAVGERDYPTIIGLILAFAALFLTINLIVDVLYRFLDPRTERGVAGV